MSTDTVRLVPLSDLVELARLVVAMRKAQQAFFDKRKATPHVPADAEWRAARDLERRVDSAAADALARSRQTLPGFDLEPAGGGSGL